ncbi:hypothetical protein PsorP6_001212 [Peronosclerospora sorghi]|uniref:Uncharacterized protein n=1 Tax=Peronosclerospora sorghi TaxID=230839 RepID=A0ACC0WWR2_9STRA|nr:hypothetical protein PsorP6_001212 [Peronosclerospora sorghi]
MMPQSLSLSIDDWALRANLQLCGSVSPPTYTDLRSAAHLQTFDVREGEAALLDASGRLFLVHVFHQSQAEQTPVQPEQLLRHVTLDPPLQPLETLEVEQIMLNASGSQVLLVAKNWVKVLRLPVPSKRKPQSLQRQTEDVSTQRFLVRFEDGSEQDVTLKGVTYKGLDALLEQVKHRATPNKRVAFVSREHCVAQVRSVGYFTIVRHVAWHPLSDTHLVVLSDAEEIEIFNTKQDVSKPEQRHPLDFPTKMRAMETFSVSFCFGASIQIQQQQHAMQMQVAQIWDAFTCYVIRSDGAVYALCPLVTYNCCVSKSFFQILSCEVDAQIALCKEKLKSNGGLRSRLIEFKSHKYWLQESWAQVSTLNRQDGSRCDGRAQISLAENATDPDMYCYLSSHVSGISPNTWPLAVQGPVDVSPQSVVEGKRSHGTSVLVVPHALRNSTENRFVSASPFLMRTFASGHVELILLDAPIRPQWRSTRQAATATNARKLPALLLECINLGIDDSGGKVVIERDAGDPRLVYCLHSTGVHVVNVSWVFDLASSRQFTALPKSSVRHVFSVSPSNATAHVDAHDVDLSVVGARVLKNVNFGHLLLLRLASASFEVVNVSSASRELLKGVLVESNRASTKEEDLQKMLPGTLASMASSSSRNQVSSDSSDGGIRSFGAIVEEKLEALSTRGTRVTGNTLMHEVDDIVLAFVLERVKILYEDVEYVDEMDQLMQDRLQLHSSMIAMQVKKILLVQEQVDNAHASLKTLQEKMERALAVQHNLSKRSAAVLQAVKENQPQLSRAEREFKSELELIAVKVRRLKSRVAELTVQGQRAVRTLQSAALSTSLSSRYKVPSSRSSSLKLSNEKKQMCFDVLNAETQLIDDMKSVLEDLRAKLQQSQK